MPGIVFFGHGNRDEGTSEGTYVIPGTVNVHFFETDGQLLNMAGARVLLAALLRNHPVMPVVNAAVVETKRAYETIPNYILTGDQNAANVCGVPGTGLYWVGQPAANGPVIPVATGIKRRLSDLVGGGNPDAANTTDVYWMCCRSSPINAAKRAPNQTVSTIDLGGHSFPKAREKVARDMGFKPSEVAARGGRWR